MDQDAFILWDDTRRLVAREPGSGRRVAMLGACIPVSLTDDVLTVKTNSAYAKRSLDLEIDLLERVLSEAAFEPMKLVIQVEREETNPMFPTLITEGVAQDAEWFDGTSSQQTFTVVGEREPATVIPFEASKTSISEDEFRAQLGEDVREPATAREASASVPEARRHKNHLTRDVSDQDLKLTFENFVEGVENRFALIAAKQVANGNNAQYNPLFIYGESGLGKTHLLMSIKNYIAQNDPTRTCAYITATDFISDYTSAMMGDRSIIEEFTNDYRDVDVLILDDIQHLRQATSTVQFFFETFNYLVSNGKQIVLAADEPPSLLGMSERISSRMGSGYEIGIQTPALELKRNLIGTFYQRYKDEGLIGYEGTIPAEVLDVMAASAGDNIRLIKSYVQNCLFLASELEKRGVTITDEDVRAKAREKWPHGQRRVSVEEIQHNVEQVMGISHADLIGTKRTREIAQARHVAIWLCHQLTDLTYAEIGARFGGRSHTTVMHSFDYVNRLLADRTDRTLIDTVQSLRRKLES